jgi:small subunit ribosomal protein S16
LSTVIRLARFGRKHQAIYRVVVADSRSPRDGKFLTQVGFYNPNLATPELRFDAENTLQWLEQGATPSETVRSLLKYAGIWPIFEAKKAGKDVSQMQITPVAFPPKKEVLSKKAKAKLEKQKSEA